MPTPTPVPASLDSLAPGRLGPAAGVRDAAPPELDPQMQVPPQAVPAMPQGLASSDVLPTPTPVPAP